MRVIRGIIPSIVAGIAAILLSIVPALSAPVGTAFTYQGALFSSGQPARGIFDLRFTLYTDPTRGLPVAGPQTIEDVRLTDGHFTTAVDFGKNVYDGTEYWLDVAIRLGNDTGEFTPLAPRQLLTPTPYALHARQAASVPAGSIDSAALQDGAVVRSINGLQDNFNIMGDGLLVETVNDSIIIRLPTIDCITYSNCYWNLRGNGNITAGTHFLGTVAGETAPLEFRVQNNRSLLHDYTGANTSPNIIGGFKNNTVAGTGATISGGGQNSGINQALASWATVGGGYSNVVQSGATGGAISGGASNKVASVYGAVGGGALNIASNYSVVAGGSRNRALSSHATIGGGEINTINPTMSGMMTIDSPHCTIGGGISNAINGALVGTISGGRSNRLLGTGGRAVEFGTIGGGEANGIFSDSFTSHYSTIGGGYSNEIHTAGSATIAGGEGNRMFLEGNKGTIGGGEGNILNGPYSTISGGRSNLVGPSPQSPDYATIGGGHENSIIFEGHYSVVGGGSRNRVEGFARYSAVLGGITNVIAMNAGGMGSIGGGSNNVVNGTFGTVPGGLRNDATNMSFAAGRRAKAVTTGAFVWADSSDFDFPSTGNNQFNLRATGGARIVTGIDGAGNPNAGVQLAAGGNAWGVISDRNAKKNIHPVNTEVVLAKLAEVPVHHWNYDWEENSRTPHIGPMAQDFKQTFYPGENDKVITTLEFDGVALAAIQGLNSKLERQLKERDTELDALRRENRALAARQEKVEKMLNALLAR